MAFGNLLIRVDAGVSIGNGHAMRCLALAQAWQAEAADERTSCIFAMAQPMPALEQRLWSEGFQTVTLSASPGSMEDAAQVTNLAEINNARWVVVDGYQFGAEYHRRLKAAGQKVLLIDDSGHTGSYSSDLVLDQNLSAVEDFYAEREAQTGLLLGPRYAMLRREFKSWRDWKRDIPILGRKIMVTMGGSDSENLSLRVVQALRLLQVEGLHTIVVAGGSNPHAENLKVIAEESGGSLQIEFDPASMPDLMAWADIAVSASGSTCWELCMLGLPAILIDAAGNQRLIACELGARQIALHIPRQQATPEAIAASLESVIGSADLRTQLSRRGRELVDGRGAGRVVAAMRARSIMMRPVQATDSRVLWEWANNPEVRQSSFSSYQIPWEEHTQWFSRKMRDPSCVFLVFEDDGTPAGTVRIDSTFGTDANVSVTISPSYRGRGLAMHFLDRSLEQAYANPFLQRVHAFIKPGNHASSQAFKTAGFLLVGTTNVQGCEALHYVRECQPVASETFKHGGEPGSRVVRCR